MSSARIWKTNSFDVGCKKIRGISSILPGLILVLSKCVAMEMATEEDFEIVSLCKPQLPVSLFRA